jgi:hypothetical protein
MQPRTGFFHVFESKQTIVTRWNAADETLTMPDELSEQDTAQFTASTPCNLL